MQNIYSYYKKNTFLCLKNMFSYHYIKQFKSIPMQNSSYKLSEWLHQLFSNIYWSLYNAKDKERMNEKPSQPQGKTIFTYCHHENW